MAWPCGLTTRRSGFLLANLRKLVASALNSSDLSQSDIVESAVDRIGALAFSDALGGALWSIKYAGDRRSWSKAQAVLSLRSKRIAPERHIRSVLCNLCLIEYVDENCRACGGRRFILAAQTSVAHVCTTCSGTGLRRYSDLWRMREMGLDRHAYGRWEQKFAAVHRKIADADTQVWHDLSEQLGHVPARIIREKVLDLPRRIHIIEAEQPGQNSKIIPDFVFCSTARA